MGSFIIEERYLYGWVEWQNWDLNGAKDPNSSMEAVIDQSSLETKSTILVECEFLNILDSSIIFNFSGK